MTQLAGGLVGPFSHGRAFSEAFSRDNPAANTGFTITIDNRYWTRLAALTFRLVTDSDSATRQVALTVNGGDGVPLAIFPAASTQAGTLTYDYSFLANVSTFNTVAATSVVSPAPAFFLQPTYTLVVSLTSGHSGDQISRIRYMMERFPTGPQGYGQGDVTDLEGARLAVARLADFVG